MIKIYYTNTNNISLSELYLSRVSGARRKKIDRIIPENQKKLSLGAGLLVSRLLPHNEEIKTAHRGKPYIENGPPFGIAHSGACAILAIGDREPVGCDIEQMRRVDYFKIGKRVFNENELNKTASSKNPQEAFFDLWTRKEAFIKCTGDGFHFETKSLNVSDSPMFAEYKGDKYYFKKYMLKSYIIMLCSRENSFAPKPEEIIF